MQAHSRTPPSYSLSLAQRTLLAARDAAKIIARKLNAHVDYDVRMYEAIRALRKWSSKDVVFDVGANDGRTIFRLMRYLPALQIFAFEPASATFELLSQRTAKYEYVQQVHLALGAEPEHRTLYLNNRSVLNSLDPDWGRMHRQAAAVEATEQVEVTTLDRFMALRDVRRVNLLKIDTEGHDLKVLEGAAEALRNGRIDIIQIEAGFDAPGRRQPSLAEIQKHLRTYDYYLYGIYNQCRGRIPTDGPNFSTARGAPEVLLFCDALFVRGKEEEAIPENLHPT